MKTSRFKWGRRSRLHKNIWLIIAVDFVIILLGLYFKWIYGIWVNNPEVAGQFGDMFGAITAIVGSLTVVLLIFSLIYQRKEIGLSRKELKNSTKELRLTRQEIQNQTKLNKLQQQTSKLQRIENTFFNLLEFNHTIKSKILFTDEIGKFNYKFTIESIRKESKYNVEDFIYAVDGSGQVTGFICFDERYIDKMRDLYNSHSPFDSKITDFYSSSMTILKYILHLSISDSRKQFFLETFVSLLRAEELIALFLYIRLYRYPDGKLVDNSIVELVDRFDAFKNLDVSILPDESFVKLKKVSTIETT